MNKQVLGTYSPEDVAIILSNDRFTHQVSGYADGTFVEATRVIPHATLYTGADGTNARTVRAVRNLDITITLHSSAESNDVLSALLRWDEDTRNGEALFNITIKDTIGRTILFSPQAFIGTNPDISFDTAINERDWVIHAVGSDTHEGGNARISPDAFGALEELGYQPEDKWRV